MRDARHICESMMRARALRLYTNEGSRVYAIELNFLLTFDWFGNPYERLDVCVGSSENGDEDRECFINGDTATARVTKVFEIVLLSVVFDFTLGLEHLSYFSVLTYFLEKSYSFFQSSYFY